MRNPFSELSSILSHMHAFNQISSGIGLQVTTQFSEGLKVNITFAERNEQQSGQRFLDSSDPRLIRHVASCETAGGAPITLPAGMDQKLSRVFEGGALIGSEATVPSPLEWDTYPQTAGMGQKLSQGFGDRVPDLSALGAAGSQCSVEARGVWAVADEGGSSVPHIAGVTSDTPGAYLLGVSGGAGSALGALGLSSLDSLTNNRNKALRPEDVRPVGRGKYCGRMCVAGFDPKTGRKVFRRVNCGSWCCSYCGPRKARTAKAQIRHVAEDSGPEILPDAHLGP